MTRTRAWSATIAVLLGLGACADGSSIVARVSDSAEASVEFGRCSLDDADSGSFKSPRWRLASVGRWLEILEPLPEMESRTDDPEDRTALVTLIGRDAGADGVGAKGPIQVEMHGSFIPGINWALGSGGRAYAVTNTMNEGASVDFVLIEASDGAHFFAGDCQGLALTEPLRQMLGASFDDTVAEMVGMRDPVRLLPPLEAPNSVAGLPSVTILNPEDAPADLLAELRLVTLAFEVPGEWSSESTICTKITEGWNDCFSLDALDSGRAPLIDAYVGPELVVEVWILDPNATLTSPVQQLGRLDLSRFGAALEDKSGAIVGVALSGTPTFSAGTLEISSVRGADAEVREVATWDDLLSDPDLFLRFTGREPGQVGADDSGP